MAKKKLIICLLFLLLLGCKRIDNNDNYIEYVTNCLNNNKITNNVGSGYKYYVPKGVKKVHDYDYNQIFLNKETKFYLYVDIISYFYNKELTINDNNSYYYQKFSVDGGGNGYIKIEKQEELYFVTLIYNYARIEFYSSKDMLGENITKSTIILNSIEYNKTIIEKILDGDLGEFSEFTYELDKPEDASSNFSQILEEYVQKEDEEEAFESDEILPDE